VQDKGKGKETLELLVAFEEPKNQKFCALAHCYNKLTLNSNSICSSKKYQI
jgi:hypothetical protein